MMQRSAALLLPALAALTCRSAPATDNLAIEIRRWSELARTDSSADELSVEVRKEALPVLAESEAALRGGRRMLAAERFAAARADLDAASYVRERAAAGPVDQARFEAEWKRMAEVLGPHLARPDPAALDGVQPAAVRALGEAALLQVRQYYESSLEYGRNTMPELGLFYLGAARAQRNLAVWCREQSGAAQAAQAAQAYRELAPDLDELDAAILDAYRPPASIDHHAAFVAASAAVKLARELDAAGLRRGALFLYLQAALESAPLRAATGRREAAELAGRLRDLEARLAGDVDHSIGRLFVETAQADPKVTAAVVDDVLPRYFAALRPRARPPARPAPRVTVTLVRWPFT
jgi:hypothetical protein